MEQRDICQKRRSIKDKQRSANNCKRFIPVINFHVLKRIYWWLRSFHNESLKLWWYLRDTTSPDVVKKQAHNTKAHGEVRLTGYGVVKPNSTVRFRLWRTRKRRGGRYGGVIPLAPLRTPQVVIRLNDECPAATPSVINFLVTFGGISLLRDLLCRRFKVNFVMR